MSKEQNIDNIDKTELFDGIIAMMYKLVKFGGI